MSENKYNNHSYFAIVCLCGREHKVRTDRTVFACDGCQPTSVIDFRSKAGLDEIKAARVDNKAVGKTA